MRSTATDYPLSCDFPPSDGGPPTGSSCCIIRHVWPGTVHAGRWFLGAWAVIATTDGVRRVVPSSSLVGAPPATDDETVDLFPTIGPVDTVFVDTVAEIMAAHIVPVRPCGTWETLDHFLTAVDVPPSPFAR